MSGSTIVSISKDSAADCVSACWLCWFGMGGLIFPFPLPESGSFPDTDCQIL